MIRLIEATSESRRLLWDLLQQYLHEMSQYYDLERDGDGNYGYKYFGAYFQEPERKALLIYDDAQLAGFALLNPHSYIGEMPDHVLAEFMILPAHRKRHIGTAAAECILRSFPGKWEIKYSELNTGARQLWNRIAAPYTPAIHDCGEGERVLAFATI